MKTVEINRTLAPLGAKFSTGIRDYIAAMSPYNFDPEADALTAELRKAQQSKDAAAFRSITEQIRVFVKRKTAAREATQKP